MRNGKTLEVEVYNMLSKMVNKEQLPFKSSQCKVFSHKKYFSKDRDGSIDTDVSIEVFIEDAVDPFFIWIWECKNYSNAIPVDDLEEFHAKLQQIGADNTKGTIITSNGYFQTGSIKYAASKKIGLARLLPDEQVEFIMHFMTSDMIGRMKFNNNYLSALTQRLYKAEMQNTFIVDYERKFSSLEDYILKTFDKRFFAYPFPIAALSETDFNKT